jgi:hypothetical protein
MYIMSMKSPMSNKPIDVLPILTCCNLLAWSLTLAWPEEHGMRPRHVLSPKTSWCLRGEASSIHAT